MTDERFFAWIDGELDAQEAARVAAEVEADPNLKARAAQHRTMMARMTTAFDTVNMAAVSAEVIDLDAARARRKLAPRAPRRWAALAATLCLGLLTTALFLGHGAVVQAPTHDGATLQLASALNTQLANSSPGPVQIRLTFRDKSGAICRTFVEVGSSGLACYEQGKWHIRGAFSSSSGESAVPGGYRMAAGLDPRVAELVDSSIAGEAFDQQQELETQRAGWR